MAARLWSPVLGAALLLAAAATADDPKGAPSDPLPTGAKARLGSTRMRDFAGGWSGVSLVTDGRALIALGSNGKSVKIDVTTGTTTGGPLTPGRAGRVEFSADGTRAVMVGFEGPAVLDLATGTTKSKCARQTPYGDNNVALSADGKVLVAGGVKDAKTEKVTALVWDVEKSDKRTEVEVLQNQAASVAVSGDGTVLATWGSHYKESKPGVEPKPEEEYGRVVQFWDATTGKERGRYQVGGYGVSTVVLAPDGKTGVVVASGGGVWLIDTANGTVRRRLFGRSDLGNRVAFSPDGKRLAVAGFDGSVQLYDAGTGARGALTACPVGPLSAGIRELKFTGPDTVTAWAVVNASAVVWEVPSGRLLSPTGGHTGLVESLAFTADSKTVVTVGGGAVLQWDPATGKQTGTVRLRPPGRSGEVESYGMRLSADALTIRAGNPPALYDIATGGQLFTLRGASDYSSEPTLCADGRTLLAAPNPPGTMPKTPPTSMRVPVWDIITGAKLTEFETRFGTLTSAAITPDRKKVVTLIGVRVENSFKLDYFVTGWDLATGKKLGDVSVTPANGQVLVAAPDNTTALVTTENGNLAVVDFVAGKAVREIDTERQAPTAVSPFGPDGKWFAVGSGYGGYGPKPAVRVYEWQTGKVVRTFRGHESLIQSLAFSPDGKTLASGSQDTTVLLWDLNEK